MYIYKNASFLTFILLTHIFDKGILVIEIGFLSLKNKFIKNTENFMTVVLRSLSEQVYDHVIRQIKLGKLLRGDSVSETKLEPYYGKRSSFYACKQWYSCSWQKERFYNKG